MSDQILKNSSFETGSRVIQSRHEFITVANEQTDKISPYTEKIITQILILKLHIAKNCST